MKKVTLFNYANPAPATPTVDSVPNPAVTQDILSIIYMEVI